MKFKSGDKIKLIGPRNEDEKYNYWNHDMLRCIGSTYILVSMGYVQHDGTKWWSLKNIGAKDTDCIQDRQLFCEKFFVIARKKVIG